jgi:chitinase
MTCSVGGPRNSLSNKYNCAAAAGLTTNIINGGLECTSGTPKAQELDRIGYFKRYCDILGVTNGDNLDCAAQQHY